MVKSGRDILNLFKLEPNLTEQGFPQLRGLKLKHTDKLHLIPFNVAYKVKQEARQGSIVHFFLSDYLFERVWTRAPQTAEFLSQYKAVLSPDFSLYADMPEPMQRWNHYRKMWVSAYWQEQGIRVIPTVGWSTEDSFKFCFEGMPKHSLVAVSSVGVMMDKEYQDRFKKGYEAMLDTLEPAQILFYGKKPEWLKEDVIHVDHYMNKRLKQLKQDR